ncbi:dynein axonemal heavy chain 7-like [Harmonia axyridis]|uniref:dynein axonemal heavy chain 7-like n=1 Tax=Harmonia axyridis TaxID=115357 RepID=UPI001E276AF3|nr:dynein axonemal heavy chain 7-like [Harmonia axyridis]
MEEKNIRNTKIISKYEKLFHHLHVEFPELTELSSKTLETFNVSKKKKSATIEVFQERIEKVKKRKEQRSTPQEGFYKNRPLFDLQEAAKKCPIMKMTRFQKREIYQLIGVPKLQSKYEDKIEEMFQEVQKEYSEVTHAVAVQQKIKQSIEIPGYFNIQPFKHIGRSKKYKIFIQRRKELHSTWMLHHPLQKSIIDEFSTLPEILLDIDRKNGEIIDFEDLEYQMQKSIIDISRIIQDFYWKIEIKVQNEMPDLHPSLLDKFFGSCTCVVSIHLSQVIKNTLNYIVNLTNSRAMPLLNVHVTFNGKMEIFPTPEQTSILFQCLIKDVLALTKPLKVLHNHKFKKNSNQRISIYLTKEFINNSLQTIHNNIFAMYEPLLDYIERLNNKIKEVYEDINGDSFISDLDFIVGCDKIRYYSNYYSKVSLIPKHVQFDTGVLNVSKFIAKIQKGLLKQKYKYFQALTSQNLWEMNDIYESFAIIKTRAETKSLTTEQTIEIGKYMTWVKSEFIQEATNRTAESLLQLATLLELGVLDDNHLSLNIKVVKELDEIEPLVLENLSMYEQLKFEAEEKLQKQIENVNEITKAVHPILCLLDEMDDILNIRHYLGKINLHLLKIKHIETQIVWINTEEVSLSFPKSAYPEFQELKNYVYPFFHLMKLSLDVQRNISVWLDGQFDLQSYDETKIKIEGYHKELTEIYKDYRKKLRQAQDDNLQMRFKGTVDDPDILNWPAPLKICSKTIKLIEDFQPCLSLMKIVCNQSLRNRHWKEMSSIAKIDLSPNAGSTLRKLLTYNLKPFLNPLEIISQGASHEQELLDIILGMRKNCQTVRLKDDVYKQTNLIIFSNLIDVVKFIAKNIEKLLILSRSAFARPHKKIIEDFSNDLVRLKDILTIYKKLQDKFYHLLPFFTFINENKEKLEQTKEFNRITEFKMNLYSTLKNENIFDLLKKVDISIEIQENYNFFKSIYFGVRQYLDSLRLKFPRFYFFSNEELIEILSNTTLDETIIEKYITKCFSGISKLKIQNKNIVAIENCFCEEIMFTANCINIDRKLVNIFIVTEQVLQKEMIQQVLTATKSNLNEEEVLSKHLSQALLIALEIWCTFLMHQIINGDENRPGEITLKLENYVKWLRDKKFSHLKKNILKNIIIFLMQYEEFIAKITLESITEEDFIWLTKIKYYLDNDICIIRVLNFSLTYGYELYEDFSLGICTPYTERCYMNLLYAYSLNSNSAIHGDACSGKTETFKQVAVALGVNYKVISCSECITYDILERLLIGSIKGRMWLCLDEINKVEFSVLSQLSDLLQKLNNSNVMVRNNQIQSFVCMTMSASFPKVTDLPMTFKSQLRCIGILPMDFSRLSELHLLASGYQNAKHLSRCVDCLFKTLPDILSRNSYRFSVKLLKKVLNSCSEETEVSAGEEKVILVRALCNTIEPMLAQDDTLIFRMIIGKIFHLCPPLYEFENTELRTKIISYLENNHLYPARIYVDRILQMAEAVTLKQNVILLGNIFSGKTNAIKTLYNLITDDKRTMEVINPSIFNTTELYGYMDFNYDLWQDGILSKIFRKFSTLDGCWLVIDSPVQSYWIETLYSVLEEKRIFTLGSGDFLEMKNSNPIIFEVADLNKASPSLVSRCCVIHFETSSEPWLELVKPWIKKNYINWPDNVQQLLEDLIFWLVPALLEFIDEHCIQVYPLGEFYLVKRTVDYIQILLMEVFARRDEDLKNVMIWLQASVFLGIYNGLTATFDYNSLIKFDIYFKQLSRNQVAEHPLPESIEKIDINVPTEGLLSEYFYIYKGRGTFKYLPDTLKNEKVIFKTYINDLMIPTSDTLRTLTILEMHILNNFPVILTGPTGTAKTLCINHYVNHVLDQSKYTSIFLKFIPRLTSKRLQSAIQSNLLKQISFNGANITRKNLIIIEDLNVLSLNENKVSGVVELMRQTLEYQFWYSNDNFEKVMMENIGFVGTIGLGDLNKNICNRLLKNFNIFRINDISDENIVRIFSNIIQVEWRKNGFAADIALVTNSLMNATLSIYEFCVENFKTSPLKFSYSYNVWDFLKVIRGLFLLKKELADSNKKIFYKLWVNECARVFGDRLVDVETRNELYKELMITFELQFKECFGEVFNKIKFQEIDNKIIFGTFANSDSRYEEMEYENLKDSLEDFSKKYQIKTGVKLVLFNEVLPKIIKISRLLAIKNSHGMLLGVSGTGRKTLIDLSSIMHKCNVFNPKISYKYDEKKWHATFKDILLHSGGQGKAAVMYLNEEHLAYPFILQDINFFLKNGDIIDLFEIEEEPMVLNMVRLDAQCGNPNVNISSHDVYAFFVERCRTKLHLFLSLNCTPTDLEMRTCMFQSLVKYCTPIWFEEWSKTAFIDISYRWIEDCNIPEKIQKKVPEFFVKFFNDSRLLSEKLFNKLGKRFHITTRTFVEFLQLYVDIISKEETALKEKKEKFLIGLRKLKYADDQIKKLQEHLCAYQLQLRIMSKKAGDMTRQIARETLDVERASDLVKKDEQIANKQAEAAAILKADCEIDLAQAIPILEDAIQALNTLKPPDITLVKSMKNPPDAIKLVMAAVCVIKDVKPDRIPDPSTGRKLIDYWGPSKRILGDMNFLQSLKDFDKDHIKPEIMVKVRKDYLSHKDFKPHVVAKASSAAEGLCKWIIAMDMYDKVAKEVAPKKEKLEKAEKEYAQTVAILEEKKLEVVRLEKQLAQLNAKLQEANKKQSRLQKTADACNRKLERSVMLLTGFEDEKVQWSNEVANLELKHKCLSGDVLLTSALISYLSAVPLEFRKGTINKWYNYLRDNSIPISENWDLTTTLISNNVDFRGLPKEKYFYENSIIYQYSHKYSLIIDPHDLALRWIQKNIDTNRLHITKYSSSNFIEDVKFCLTSGKLLLVQNVGKDISSSLNTIFNKESTPEEDGYFLDFEGEHLKFNKSFQLIILTKLRSPNYKSEISDKIKILDFTTTNHVLQKKLLGLVIKTENSLVSKQISIYKKKQVKNENLMKQYQENILKTLSNAEADLLEDNKALKILDDTKTLYKSINKEIYLPDKVVPTFEGLEKNYTEFSHYACNIFLCIEEFCRINKNIKFSYKQFLSIFRKSILEAPLSSDIVKRIHNINLCFTFTISRYIGRIVSPGKALNFLFHISCTILLFKGMTSKEEIQLLCKISDAKRILIPTQICNQLKGQLQDNQEDIAKKMQYLQQVEEFKDIMKFEIDNQMAWNIFLDQKNPEDHQLPHPWQNKLNELQKFILLQTLRPDRTKECMRKFISNILGEQYICPYEINLEELYAESFCLSPILFLTTNNSSPLNKIKNFAMRKKFYNKFRSICISEGDNTLAETLIINGQTEGLWVCILNCHLSKTWKYNLEKICEVMSFENTHENFRLWLVSDVSFDLTNDLQEKCVRIVYGDTDSFKSNLLVSYKEFVDDVTLQEYQNYSNLTVRLIYRMVCFHTVIKWRSMFKSSAWNNPFEFGDYDLRVALKLLPTIIDTFVPKDAYKYLIGETFYCGQFLDELDYEVSKTLFQEFINLDEVSLFSIPTKNDIHDYIAHIKDKLPSEEVPELFGFNEVSLRRKNISESSLFNSYISSRNQLWNDNIQYEQLKEMIKTSYELIDVKIGCKTRLNTDQKMLEFVLKQEIECYTKLRNQLLKYLKILETTLTNNLLLSSTLQEIVNDMLKNKIPKKFLKYSFVSNLNYSSFILNLRERLLFVKGWESMIPDSFWISAFFHPNALLTTQKILYTQKFHKNLEEFSNIYQIEDSSENNGFKIYGLYLINAKLNYVNKHIELLPRNIYSDEMSPISIIPLSENKELSYNCPVYRTDRRSHITGAKYLRNFIFMLEFESNVPKNMLVKLGVASVCEKPKEYL